MSYSGAVRPIGSARTDEASGFLSNSGAFSNIVNGAGTRTLTTTVDIEPGDTFICTPEVSGPGSMFINVERTGARTIVVHMTALAGGPAALGFTIDWARVFS